MKVVKQYPPNFKQIVEVFPKARSKGVIFAYGDLIYAPTSNRGIDPHLLAHESIHGRRQLEIGIEKWWYLYLNDRDFRHYEELLAHRAEYESMVESGWNKDAALKLVSKRLCSGLYGSMGARKTIERQILNV